MFHLHLLTGLISSKKYWRVVKKLVAVLKGVIQVKFYFHEILTKIQMKEKRLKLKITDNCFNFIQG